MDTTLVSALKRDGTSRPQADSINGVAAARRNKAKVTLNSLETLVRRPFLFELLFAHGREDVSVCWAFSVQSRFVMPNSRRWQQSGNRRGWSTHEDLQHQAWLRVLQGRRSPSVVATSRSSAVSSVCSSEAASKERRDSVPEDFRVETIPRSSCQGGSCQAESVKVGAGTDSVGRHRRTRGWGVPESRRR